MVDKKVGKLPAEFELLMLGRSDKKSCKKIKCMFCHRTLAVVGENGDPKGIEIRCPKCKKVNKF